MYPLFCSLLELLGHAMQHDYPCYTNLSALYPSAITKILQFYLLCLNAFAIKLSLNERWGGAAKHAENPSEVESNNSGGASEEARIQWWRKQIRWQ